MKLSEDWWSVIIGGFLLSASIGGMFGWIPKIGSWTVNPLEAFGDKALQLLILGILLLVLFLISDYADGKFTPKHVLGFATIYVSALVGILLASQQLMKTYGLEYVLWALLIGLIIGNIIKVPRWLSETARTELFIKIGLVLLGAEILFQTILAAGLRGMLQAVVVVFSVWYFCYYLSLRMGIRRSMSAVMATGVSICGVSAAIAAGGAIKGDPKEVSYVVSIILLVALPMLVLMPYVAKLLSLPDPVAGAWIGGVIDTTPAVIAAGLLYSNTAMEYAAIVKMSQNALIGLAAFLLAVYWTTRVDVRGDEKPSVLEIWYRFPKFILGFIVASLVFSFILVPLFGMSQVKSITSATSALRTWFFALAFTSIGINTKLREWLGVGLGKPLAAFLLAQTFNVFLTLGIAYILFGGVV